MNNRYCVSLSFKRLVATLAAALFGCSLSAQVGPAQDPSTAADQPVVLSPFVITGSQQGRYQPMETTSGGRVRVNLFDAPQSVSVVTRELMEDVSAGRLLDGLQYISGVTESTIPNGLDRTTIRGFQTDGQRIDNFSAPNQVNLDPVFVERIEVVKGPNAVLAPAGVPGGTINAVTRRPQFKDFGSVTGIVGLFNAQRVEFDLNRVLTTNRRVAFRVVGAYQDTEGYAGDPRRSFAIMPMVTFRTEAGAELLVQTAYTNSHVQNYFGIPIDPSSGTNNRAHLLAGVPRDLNTAGDDYRNEERPEIRALLTVPFTEEISMRLAARYTDFDISFMQSLATTSISGGGVDPATGAFVPGTIWGPAPTFTASPAPGQPRTFVRNGTEDKNHYSLFNAQNDYSFVFKNDLVSSTTVIGGALDMTRQGFKSVRTTRPNINYDAPAADATTRGALATRQDTNNYALQGYISESLSVLHERVILNGGYSYNSYDQSTDNLLPNLTAVPTPEPSPVAKYRTNITTELKSYGILVKPIPNVALYYQYSENSTPNSAYNIGFNRAAPLQSGQQDEYGVRVQLFDNRVTASLAYFDIMQSNYSVPNPGNYVPNPPSPPLPALVSDRLAKGYEFELRAQITPELSLLGNLTTFTNRDPNGVPFRGTAEKSGAVLANYQFNKQSSFSGFSFGVGVTYLGERPGDSASGVTSASTSANIIPVQPSFYLPARTLVNVNAAYRFNANWRAQVNIDNLLNEDYLAASITRYVVIPGDEINARLRVTYSF